MNKSFPIVAALAFFISVVHSGLVRSEERIGYSCSNFNDTFQMHILEAARDEAEKQGFKLLVEDAGEDESLQADHIENMISEGITALLVVPVNTSNVDHIIKSAEIANIPVVFVNRNPFPGERPPDRCFVIATDARVEGETQMNYAGSIIGMNGSIVILQGILKNDAAVSRTEGVLDVITQSYPELAITAEAPANWQRDQAKPLMEKWIESFGREKIDAVLSNNDEMALGAIEALEEAGIGDVVVIGVDGIPEALGAIRDGRMTGTVFQDPGLQGRGAIGIAVRALRGKSQAQNFILPSELITAKTVEKYMKVAE